LPCPRGLQGPSTRSLHQDRPPLTHVFPCPSTGEPEQHDRGHGAELRGEQQRGPPLAERAVRQAHHGRQGRGEPAIRLHAPRGHHPQPLPPRRRRAARLLGRGRTTTWRCCTSRSTCHGPSSSSPTNLTAVLGAEVRALDDSSIMSGVRIVGLFGVVITVVVVILWLTAHTTSIKMVFTFS
jgi:hypothetical protein